MSWKSEQSHGTLCASIAAASGNDFCSVGIAPNATVSACRILDPGSFSVFGPSLAVETYNSSYLYLYMENMHVSSNSYGRDVCHSERSRHNSSLQMCPFTSTAAFSPCSASACANVNWNHPTASADCEQYFMTYCENKFEEDAQACSSFLDLFTRCEFFSQPPQELQAMVKGVTEGRSGKGIIFVFAAGNEYDSGDDVNFYGNLNSRYTISVGAVSRYGVHASYSTGGAPLFVSAPSGGTESYTNNVVALAGGGCTGGDYGTSTAAPVVSGVVALILQTNTELTWRDVQGVLAATSRKVQPDSPSWSTNAAGFHHSYLYGFGLVDANAAVNAAKT